MSTYSNNNRDDDIKKKNRNTIYWVVTLLVFLWEPVLGIILAILKLWMNYQNKQKEKDNQQRRRNPYYQSSSSQRDSGSKLSQMTNPKRGNGMIITGVIVALIFVMCMIGAGNAGTFTIGLALTVLGIIMIWYGQEQNKQAKRYREYLNIIGKQNCISLRDLARISNTEFSTVSSDISNLVYQGALGREAYIDKSCQYLVLNADGRKELADKMKLAEERRSKEAEERAREKEEKDYAVLAEIHHLNDEIEDEKISAQIDRIEDLTRQILQYQEEHPDSSSQLRTFLNYYLPTTLKMLNTYAEMEKKSVQGENIKKTRKQIEDIMNKIVTAFEKQLDKLYANERMDVTNEITVLEKMLERDGLTNDPSSDPFAEVKGQNQGQ